MLAVALHILRTVALCLGLTSLALNVPAPDAAAQTVPKFTITITPSPIQLEGSARRILAFLDQHLKEVGGEGVANPATEATK